MFKKVIVMISRSEALQTEKSITPGQNVIHSRVISPDVELEYCANDNKTWFYLRYKGHSIHTFDNPAEVVGIQKALDIRQAQLLLQLTEEFENA